jgi:integrase
MEIEEIAKLFDVATTSCLREFILLMLGTAARPDAIHDLTFDRCDLENRLIILNPPEREQTKKHRPTVKLPKSLEGMLRRAEMARKCDHVLTFGGRPVKSIRQAWRAARENAGLDERVNPLFTPSYDGALASQGRRLGLGGGGPARAQTT